MKAVSMLACLLPVALAGTNEFGKKFLEENKGKEGVVTLPSGLQYKVLREGHGDEHPLAGTSCECHYEGRTAQEWSKEPKGTKFDSSYDRGSPTSFAPNQVIKGWTEAMQLMVEGDKWEMYIPSELGYGDSGSGAKIGGGDVLVFTMEIVKIKGETKPADKCDPATLEKCNDKEKAYIEKMKGKDAAALKKELGRLNPMRGKKMQPELTVWLNKRIKILEKLSPKDEL